MTEYFHFSAKNGEMMTNGAAFNDILESTL